MPRYDISQLHDGWAVIDLTTGKPAELDGDPQRGMLIEDASDLADEMNAAQAAATSLPPGHRATQPEPHDPTLSALRELRDEHQPQQKAPPERG